MWCPAWSSAEEISKTVPSSVLRPFLPHNLALWGWRHLQYWRELTHFKLSTFVQIYFSLTNQLDDCSIASLLKNLIGTHSSVKIEIRYMNLPYIIRIVLKYTCNRSMLTELTVTSEWRKHGIQTKADNTCVATSTPISSSTCKTKPIFSSDVMMRIHRKLYRYEIAERTPHTSVLASQNKQDMDLMSITHKVLGHIYIYVIVHRLLWPPKNCNW